MRYRPPLTSLRSVGSKTCGPDRAWAPVGDSVVLVSAAASDAPGGGSRDAAALRRRRRGQSTTQQQLSSPGPSTEAAARRRRRRAWSVATGSRRTHAGGLLVSTAVQLRGTAARTPCPRGRRRGRARVAEVSRRSRSSTAQLGDACTRASQLQDQLLKKIAEYVPQVQTSDRRCTSLIVSAVGCDRDLQD